MSLFDIDDDKLQMALMIDKLSLEVKRLQGLELAAVHFLEVISMTSGAGVATFRVNEGQEENLGILQHAIWDLHSKLTGAPAPPLALADRVIH